MFDLGLVRLRAVSVGRNAMRNATPRGGGFPYKKGRVLVVPLRGRSMSGVNKADLVPVSRGVQPQEVHSASFCSTY